MQVDHPWVATLYIFPKINKNLDYESGSCNSPRTGYCIYTYSLIFGQATVTEHYVMSETQVIFLKSCREFTKDVTYFTLVTRDMCIMLIIWLPILDMVIYKKSDIPYSQNLQRKISYFCTTAFTPHTHSDLLLVKSQSRQK